MKLGAWRTWAEAQRWLPLGEGYFSYVAGVLGHTLETRSVVLEVEARREGGYSAAPPSAWTYLGLGETAAGLEWPGIFLAEQDPFLGSAMVFPAGFSLRIGAHGNLRRFVLGQSNTHNQTPRLR
jgi:hypothetical protein